MIEIKSELRKAAPGSTVVASGVVATWIGARHAAQRIALVATVTCAYPNFSGLRCVLFDEARFVQETVQKLPSRWSRENVHDSVWDAVIKFYAAVQPCRFVRIGDNRCRLDFRILDQWMLNAAVRASADDWVEISVNAGTALALWDACYYLACDPAFRGHASKTSSDAEPKFDEYEECGCGEPFTPIRTPDSPSGWELTLALFKAAARFVVCHEIAHFMLGHIYAKGDSSDAENKVLEFEADACGADLCTRSILVEKLTPIADEYERIRIAVSGAMVIFSIFGGLKSQSPRYPTTRTRCLTVLWVLFSKRFYPHLPVKHPLWKGLVNDSRVIAKLFGFPAMRPESFLEVYTHRTPTDEGMKEMDSLIKSSDEHHLGWQEQRGKVNFEASERRDDRSTEG